MDETELSRQTVAVMGMAVVCLCCLGFLDWLRCSRMMALFRQINVCLVGGGM